MKRAPASHYDRGEEKFGWLMSFGYLLAVKFGAMRDFTLFAVDDIERSNARSVLDVGTGVAELPLRLSENKDLEIFAIDPSKQMVRIARARARNRRNIRIAQGSSRHVPFRRKFDIIVSSLSFHHWARREKALVYLKKFLNRNGEIRIYEYNRTKLRGAERAAKGHAMSRAEFEEIAEGAGLRVNVSEKGAFVKASFR